MCVCEVVAIVGMRKLATPVFVGHAAAIPATLITRDRFIADVRSITASDARTDQPGTHGGVRR